MMKRQTSVRRKGLLAPVILSLLVATTSSTPRALPARSDLFPQGPGNQWTYVRTALGQPATWTNQIDQTTLGRWRHTNYWGDGKARWLTENLLGDVFEVPSESQQNLWYRFSAGAGAVWTMAVSSGTPPCVDGARLTIASRGRVEVPAGTFDNSVVITYRTNCADAGVVAEWFAPGVGLVKRTETSFAGEVTTVLQSAKVKGVDYPAGVKVEVNVDRATYSYDLMPPLPRVIPGPTVRAQINLVNNSTDELVLDFRTSQRFDFTLENEKGKVVYRWSSDKFFLQVLGRQVVKPGESLSFAESFSLPDSTVGILPEGVYALKAFIASEVPYSGSIPVKIVHAH